jgi:hypothetical protein
MRALITFSNCPDTPNNHPFNGAGPGSYVESVAFSPDGCSVACHDSQKNEKAFDVASGAALPGAPAGRLAWWFSVVLRVLEMQ